VDSPTLANTGMRDSSGLIIVAAMIAMAGGATYLASMATSRPRRRNEH
jgi:LPXTG-motif cell wall-anchored protein